MPAAHSSVLPCPPPLAKAASAALAAGLIGVLPAILPLSMLAAAAQPDVLVFDSDRSGNFEICTMALDGGGTSPLTSDTAYDSWWGRPSPDGARILFYRTPRGVHDTDYGRASLWRMNSDGTGLVQLRAALTDGWTIQGHGEWSPDGSSIATIGTAGGALQIFVTDADGLHPRQVTTGSARKIDCSWSRDGADLLVVSTPASGGAGSTQEVYRVPAVGGALVRLTNDGIEDYDPYCSPDGSRIAWLSLTDPAAGVWNIRVMDADGGNVGRITDDANVNSKPEWSRDGTTIYFHRLVYAPDAKFDVYRTPASGGGAITLVSPGAPGNNEYPALLHHAPVVAITGPAAGAVAGPVAITADAVGAVAIVSVRFEVDGGVIATDASAPYACTWNPAGAGAGSHVVRAITVDAVGASATSAGLALTVAGSAGGGGSADDGGSGGCGLGSASSLLALASLVLGARLGRSARP